MPIVNHDLKNNQFAGIQHATYEISGAGDLSVEVPLTGPKQIRRIVVVTGANGGGGAKTLQVLQKAGGTAMTAAKDVKLAANSYVTFESNEFVSGTTKLDSTFDGLCFKLDNSGGADAWSLRVEVLFSPRTNINNNVYMDEKIEGIL